MTHDPEEPRPAVSRPGVAATLIIVLVVIAVVTGISLANRSDPAPKPARTQLGATGPATSGPSGSHARGNKHHPGRRGGDRHKPGRHQKPLTPKQRKAQALGTVRKLDAREPSGAISVAVVNTSNGARFTAGAKSGMWTASAYKLLVLETLLLQNGGPLYGYQASEAVPMIENSDNAAGYSLFLAAGGNGGLESALQRFGMTHTVPGVSDPTFTRTSAADYIRLVRNLVGPGPLTPSAQAYAKNLMRNVEADQRWGVGVVADKGSVFYNKNGWLSVDDSNGPGETDEGRWAVTSVGIVKVHGQQLLMSVFTQHQPDMGAGIDLVEKLARAIAPAVVRS
jgi:Beta-lactamase enzyme family